MLSEKERVIVGLLEKSAAPLYGLDMVSMSEGRLARGAIYLALSRLEDRGIVTSFFEEKKDGYPGAPRRLYKLSGASP